MEIARGEAGAGDVHFAGDADGSRLQEGVEDVDLQVGDGSADEAGGGVEIGGGKGAIGDMDGGFGDAVHVDELRGVIAVAVEPGFEALQVESFAAEDDQAQSRACGPEAA